MKVYEILSEKRKLPKQNPKTPINDIVINQYNSAPYLDIIEDKNCFVSFTSVDKLGINPKSEWDTPLGIYAYPAFFVVEQIGNDLEMDKLPFAGDSPFVNIFQTKGNIINLEKLSNQELIQYYQKISEYFAKHSGMSWKESVDVVEHYINNADRKAKFDDYAGGRLWYVSMKIAQELSSSRDNQQGKNTHIIWNHLFRSIGIDAAYDPGIGIIHTSEKSQTVFFSIIAITNVKRFNNKYSPDTTNDMIQHGQNMKSIMDKLNSAKTPSELADVIIELSDDPEQPLEYALEEYKIANLLQKMHNTPAKQYILNNYTQTRAYNQSYIPMALKTAKSLQEIENLMKYTTYYIGLQYLKKNPFKGQFLQKYPTMQKWQEHLDMLEFEDDE